MSRDFGSNDARVAALDLAITALPNGTAYDHTERAEIYYGWLCKKWLVYTPPIDKGKEIDFEKLVQLQREKN